MTPLPRLLATFTTKRTFTNLSRLRQTIRAAEPHPFERYPTTQTAARADWGKQFRHIGDAAIFFVPSMALFLGWPIIAEKLMDGHIV